MFVAKFINPAAEQIILIASLRPLAFSAVIYFRSRGLRGGNFFLTVQTLLEILWPVFILGGKALPLTLGALQMLRKLE
jgi:hypothetical protein